MRKHLCHSAQAVLGGTVALSLLLFSTTGAIAQKSAPDYAWGGYNDKDPHDGMQGGWWFNVGPTGVRAKPELKEPKVLVVKYVFPDSPAGGKIKVGDKIVGVNGKIFQVADHFIFRGAAGKHPFGAKHYFGFDDGPRLDVGMAVEESEGNPSLKGILTFMVVRDGKKIDVPVQLRQIGYFSKNFPFDCPKSKLLASEAAAWIAKEPDNYRGGDVIGKSASLLALMSQGNTHMPTVKAYMRSIAGGNGGAGWTWVAPLMTIPTAEYYLATGDEALAPLLRRQEKTLGDLQGPNGAYMHKAHKPGGYSEMAFPAGLCGVAWALLKQCDIPVNSNKYEKTRLLLTASTADYGGIGYGTMWTGYQPLKMSIDSITVDPSAARPNDGVFDGGSRLAGGAACATVMHYLDPMDKISEAYVKRGIRHAFNSRRACTSGHLTGYFTTEWVMIAASLGTVMDDMQTYRAFMDHWKYWFNAARCHNGGWYFEPTSDNQLAAWHSPRRTITCAAIMLLSVPQHNLAILGRDPMIPGIDKSCLSQPALRTYEMIKRKRGLAATQIASIDTIKKTASGDEATALDLMTAYVMKPIDHKLSELQQICSAKDMYKLQEQLASFDPKYKGVQAYDSQTRPFREALSKPESRKLIETGRLYYTKLVPLYDDSAATVSFNTKKTTRLTTSLSGPSDAKQLGAGDDSPPSPMDVPVYEVSRAMKKGQVLKSTKEFTDNYPEAPYSQMARELAQEYLKEMDDTCTEIASLQQAGDVFKAAGKLTEADNEFGTYSNYLDRISSVRQVLATPESRKFYQAGAAYYKILETATSTGAKSPRKGQILQAVKTFMDANSSTPYARMAGEYSQGLMTELDTAVNEIATLQKSGDPLTAAKKLEEADKEYSGFAEYTQKVAPTRAALATPESRKLMQVGLEYSKLEEAIKPDSKFGWRKGQILQAFNEFLASYGETSYASMARIQVQGPLAALDAVINDIIAVQKAGDPCKTLQKIEEVNKDYGMCKLYLEKLAPIKKDLSTPESKKLIMAGTSYYRMLDEIGAKPGSMVAGGPRKKAMGDAPKKRLELFARQYTNTIYAKMALDMAASYK